MFQYIPYLLLLIAVTGVVLSVAAFVISIFAPPVSARLTRWTEKLVFPVHVLLVCTILGALTKSDVLHRFVGIVKDFLPHDFLAN